MTGAATKSNVAYDRARRDIVTGCDRGERGHRRGGPRPRYGLGRTPIREALKQLRNDQLIVGRTGVRPTCRRSGWPSEVALRGAVDLRDANRDPGGATHHRGGRRAAGRASRQEGDLVEQGLAYEAAEVDLLFHRGVAEATGNPFLVDASTRINVSALRIWYQMIVPVGMIAQEHADIVAALREHDVEHPSRRWNATSRTPTGDTSG